MVVFEKWLRQIREKPMLNALGSRVKKLTQELRDGNAAVFPNYRQKSYCRLQADCHESYFRMLAAIATENMSFLKEIEARYFTDGANFHWLPQAGEAAGYMH